MSLSHDWTKEDLQELRQRLSNSFMEPRNGQMYLPFDFRLPGETGRFPPGRNMEALREAAERSADLKVESRDLRKALGDRVSQPASRPAAYANLQMRLNRTPPRIANETPVRAAGSVGKASKAGTLSKVPPLMYGPSTSYRLPSGQLIDMRLVGDFKGMKSGFNVPVPRPVERYPVETLKKMLKEGMPLPSSWKGFGAQLPLFGETIDDVWSRQERLSSRGDPILGKAIDSSGLSSRPTSEQLAGLMPADMGGSTVSAEAKRLRERAGKPQGGFRRYVVGEEGYVPVKGGSDPNYLERPMHAESVRSDPDRTRPAYRGRQQTPDQPLLFPEPPERKAYVDFTKSKNTPINLDRRGPDGELTFSNASDPGSGDDMGSPKKSSSKPRARGKDATGIKASLLETLRSEASQGIEEGRTSGNAPHKIHQKVDPKKLSEWKSDVRKALDRVMATATRSDRKPEQFAKARERLDDLVYSGGRFGNEQAVDAHMSEIFRELGDPGPDYVRGWDIESPSIVKNRVGAEKTTPLPVVKGVTGTSPSPGVMIDDNFDGDPVWDDLRPEMNHIDLDETSHFDWDDYDSGRPISPPELDREWDKEHLKSAGKSSKNKGLNAAKIRKIRARRSFVNLAQQEQAIKAQLLKEKLERGPGLRLLEQVTSEMAERIQSLPAYELDKLLSFNVLKMADEVGKPAASKKYMKVMEPILYGVKNQKADGAPFKWTADPELVEQARWNTPNEGLPGVYHDAKTNLRTVVPPSKLSKDAWDGLSPHQQAIHRRLQNYPAVADNFEMWLMEAQRLKESPHELLRNRGKGIEAAIDLVYDQWDHARHYTVGKTGRGGKIVKEINTFTKSRLDPVGRAPYWKNIDWSSVAAMLEQEPGLLHPFVRDRMQEIEPHIVKGIRSQLSDTPDLMKHVTNTIRTAIRVVT